MYVRQSTKQQVAEHQESTRLQYALVERAAALGWSRSRITVIDDDLGRTAAVADSRPGFQKLVTEVTMGRVGIVLGIEMSRLARTGRAWHQLLELCCLSGCLLADPDGVYDPSYYNDRLLLGLKGTMSEAELYLIKQRMASGRLAKAERGELAVQLPIGYVRRACGEVVLDPDEQARHVVRLVFDTFERIGTLNGVLRYLVDHEIQMPVRARCGPEKGELQWRRPNRETLQIMLHNPIYAGYYAYGRRRIETRRKIPGRVGTGRVVRDQDEWLVALPDRMPAYITVERYEANIKRMAANRQIADSPGAPRCGAALLSGLLCCGLCGGHRMTVQYHNPSTPTTSHSYTCGYVMTNYATAGSCQHIAGPALDRYVTDQVLAAIAPAALEVSLSAAAQAEAERATLDKLWRQRVERAQFAADRARRQYQLAEPENRLVVRQLEKDWDQAMAEAERLEGDHRHFTEAQPHALSAAERAAICTLARDLPALWHAPSTTMAERKEILRTLIEKITVAVLGRSELVEVTITWAGGHQSRGQAVRPVGRLDQLSYYPRLIERVATLAAQGRTTAQIADQLNDDGLRPPKRTSRFVAAQVLTLMNQHDIRRAWTRAAPASLSGLGPGEWSVTELAATLQMPTATVHNWIYREWITARRTTDGHHWIVTADARELDRPRDLRTRPRGYYARQRFTNPPGPPPEEGAEQ